MKNFKPSQFLAVSMIVGAFFSALAVRNANAVPSTQYNRSVRDMMARRHNASVKPRFGSAKKVQPNATTVSSSPRAGRSVAQTIYSAPKTMYEATSTSSTLASWFNPVDKDGSLFPGGPCTNCHESGPLIDTGPCDRCYDNGPLIDTGPCDRCYDNGPLIDTGPCESCKEPAPKVEPVPVPVCAVPNYTISYNDYIVQAMSRNCCAFAPLYLEHVDFNLSEDETSIKNKMGNYRFRIFGCRRFDKEAVLNHGRVMEKNMRFNDIFEQITGDCYNIVPMPQDICLQKTPSPLPEYILTAEITNFFMNVCDGYDWENSKASDSRSGSSEITIKWKLSNPSKTRIVWEGETTGYADLKIAEEQGEIALVEAAFADAVSNLQALRGFENQLMIRLSPEELSAERQALIDEERALDPAKCKFAEPLYQARQCELTRPEANIMECPAVVKVVQQPCPVVEPCPAQEECPQVEPCPVIEENSGITADYSLLDNCIDENGGVIAGGDCQIVDDTWVDTGDAAFDSLCITTRAPYDVLTPENLYKVRASVVEISNNKGQKGAGLIVSDTFVLTSADLVDNQSNTYKIRTINGKELSGHAVRVNPSKNTALVMLETPTLYTPLPLNTDLPTVGQKGFMTLGLLDVEEFDNGSENYIDNSGKVLGYRYSDDKGSEIIVDTNVQDLVIGSVLIDSHGSVNGFAHTGKKTEAGKDLFLPTETALRSLGLTICDCAWEAPSKFEQTVYEPVTELIVKAAPVAPEVMKPVDRK
ncbi:MAG: hypothetical protein IJ870_03840 [Alphaproteobacteria bacterium]|nr:hypothetical protein [Alphaproteobacteria bacterium]